MEFNYTTDGGSIESPSVVCGILAKPLTTAIGNPTTKEESNEVRLSFHYTSMYQDIDQAHN